jgi:hypothetical protein
MTRVPAFGVPEILVHDEGETDVSQARKFTVPELSITPVEYDPSDTADVFARLASPHEGAAANRRRGRSGGSAGGHDGDGGHPHERRDRSTSIQLTPTTSPVRGESRLSPQHRPSPSSHSIQPDWHFAAAIGGAAAHRHSPPVSPGLGRADEAAARSRANSAVSQNEVERMFQDSAWGQSMRRSVTQKQQQRSTFGGEARKPSS